VATIDHVTLRASDLQASVELFTRCFELLEYTDVLEEDGLNEWNDFSLAPAEPGRPATRNLHVGFAATSPGQIDNWWQELTGAGYEDDGPPGPRPEYSPGYYGAFVRDHDGNSIEAALHENSTPATGLIDHLWIRVRDLEATRRFYEAVAPVVGLRIGERPSRLAVIAETGTFSFVEGTSTENLHLAIGVDGRQTVREFHAAGLEAGGVDNGAPGERPEYHEGYFGAYIRDPDDNNIEAVFHDR